MKINSVLLLSLAIITTQCDGMRSGQRRISSVVPTAKAQEVVSRVPGKAASHARGLLSKSKARLVSLKDFITMKDSQVRKMTKKKYHFG